MLKANSKTKLAAVLLMIFGLFVSGVSAQAQNARKALVDFNGDGKSDWAIIRSQVMPGAPYDWYIRYNGSDNFITLRFGQRGNDMPVPLDYDGDNKADIAVYRTNAPVGAPNQIGNYYILNSSTGTLRTVFVGGVRGDQAVPADYDGDGTADPAAFISPTVDQGAGPSYWCYVGSQNNLEQKRTCVQWGMRYGTQADSVDDPYPGDFDGDGKADFAVQRILDTTQTNTNTPAIFYIQTATGQISYEYFGWKSDRILPGDYNGDGKTDIAVARGFNIASNPPTPINWFIRYRNGQPDETVSFGNGSNFNFAQGDYDGDGKDDIALLVPGDANAPRYFAYRPSSNPSAGFRAYPWGASGDLPAAGYNNR